MLTGYEERAARMVTSALVEKGLLTATTHRAALRIAFAPFAQAPKRRGQSGGTCMEQKDRK